MLGIIGFTDSWNWAAVGKHPALKDYFTLGVLRQVGQGFREWVQAGYERASAREGGASRGFYSWRFWMKDPRKGFLACGLLRDSSDSLGRPYPLLIIGSGSLQGWEERWDLLPLACERSWEQMESISTRTFFDFNQLQEEVRRIKPPRPQWSKFLEVQQESPATGKSPEGVAAIPCQTVENSFKAIGAGTGVLIPIDDPRNIAAVDLGCMVAWEDRENPKVTARWVRGPGGTGWVDPATTRFASGRTTPMDFGFLADSQGTATFDEVRAAVRQKSQRQPGSPQ